MLSLNHVVAIVVADVSVIAVITVVVVVVIKLENSRKRGSEKMSLILVKVLRVIELRKNTLTLSALMKKTDSLMFYMARHPG